MSEQAEEQIKKAFIDGFNMSGEGFNAEYGCDTCEVEAMADRYNCDADNSVCACKQEHKKLTDSDILEIAEQQATLYCELEQEPFIFDGMDIAAFARAIEAKVQGENND